MKERNNKGGGGKVVKKEMKTVKGITGGQEYGWIPDGMKNKKDRYVSRLPPSKKVVGLIPVLHPCLYQYRIVPNLLITPFHYYNSFKQKQARDKGGKKPNMWLFVMNGTPCDWSYKFGTQIF